MEDTFFPQIHFGLNEILKGIPGEMPALDGFVRTGPKGGMAQLILTSNDQDPILAVTQSGLGRSVAFTSTADGRWAGEWLGWENFGQFWEQVVRWVSKPAQASDCEVFADVKGRDVTITVETIGGEGEFVQLTNILGQTIAPDMTSDPMSLVQVGPGRYRGQFKAQQSGSYIVNLQYSKPGMPDKTLSVQSAVTVPFAPEYRDLTDNSALLSEVSRITGGRVIESPAEQANLFERSDLKFPETPLPLMEYLMLIWLGLFLLDVAVRRIAWDVRASARALVKVMENLGKGRATDPTLERLKQTRQQLRDQWARQAPEVSVSRRYESGAKAGGDDLPLAKTTPPKPTTPAAPTVAKKADGMVKPADKEAKKVKDASHIEQLLKAKRASKQKEQNNEE